MDLKYRVFTLIWTKALYWQATISYWFSEDIWTSLISVDRLHLQVVIVYVGVYSKTICTRAQGTWPVGVAELHVCICRYKWGRSCNVKVWFPECPLFGGRNTLQKRFGTKVSAVRSWEVVASRRLPMYYKYGIFNPWLSRALSALGSVSASRSVRSGRFYCRGVTWNNLWHL